MVVALQWEAEATFRNEEEKCKKTKEEDWRLFWVSAKSGIRDLPRDRRQRRGTGKEEWGKRESETTKEGRVREREVKDWGKG